MRNFLMIAADLRRRSVAAAVTREPDYDKIALETTEVKRMLTGLIQKLTADR